MVPLNPFWEYFSNSWLAGTPMHHAIADFKQRHKVIGDLPDDLMFFIAIIYTDNEMLEKKLEGTIR